MPAKANANKARGTRTRRNVLHVSKVWGRYRWRTSYVCLRFVRMALHVAMERGHTFRGGANG